MPVGQVPPVVMTGRCGFVIGEAAEAGSEAADIDSGCLSETMQDFRGSRKVEKKIRICGGRGTRPRQTLVTTPVVVALPQGEKPA